MKKIFYLFLICVLLSMPLNNSFASAPSESSAIGQVLKNVFKDYGDCYHNFFLWSSDISEENNKCKAVNAGLISAMILGMVGGPLVALGVGVGYMSTLFGAAEGIRNSAKICRISPDSDDIQPAPYTDDMINQLLGGNASVEEIVDKYNKICVEYHGQKIWIKQNQCGSTGGATFCAYTYMDTKATFINSIQNDNPSDGNDPEYLCVRVSSTCPCSFPLQNGIISGPEYQKDGDGVYKLKADGTPSIANEVSYSAHAAMHCRALRRANSVKLIAKPPNTDIIDEVCYSWSGYSKNYRSLISPVIQCIQNTLNNLFNKPMAVSRNNSTLTTSQEATYTNYNNDYRYVTNMLSLVTVISNEILTATSTRTQNDLQNLASYINSVNNGIAFTAGPYGPNGIGNPNITSLTTTTVSTANPVIQQLLAIAIQALGYDPVGTNDPDQILTMATAPFGTTGATDSNNMATAVRNLQMARNNLSAQVLDYNTTQNNLTQGISTFSTLKNTMLANAGAIEGLQNVLNSGVTSCPLISNANITDLRNNNACAWRVLSAMQCGSATCVDTNTINYCPPTCAPSTCLCYLRDFLTNTNSFAGIGLANYNSASGGNPGLVIAVNTYFNTIGLAPITNSENVTQISNAISSLCSSTITNQTCNGTGTITDLNNHLRALCSSGYDSTNQTCSGTGTIATLNQQIPILQNRITYMCSSGNAGYTNPPLAYNSSNPASTCPCSGNGLITVAYYKSHLASGTTTLSYVNLGQIQQELTILANKIDKDKITFMSQALQANSMTNALTPFQSVQGRMQTFVLIILVIYVMMIGYRMVIGEFTPNVSNLTAIFMDFAIVYYFAMGSAWRDYFFNMILNVSVGLGEFAMSVTNDYVSDRGQDNCNNYMNNFYQTAPTATCTFPNFSILKNNPRASVAQLLVPQIVAYDQRTKQNIIGCMKGPFIVTPNYETPYVPVMVYKFNNDGTTSSNFMNVYCYNNQVNSNRVVAIPINNLITLEPIRLVCPADGICQNGGCTMEDGYRISELIGAGFSMNKLTSANVSGDSYGVISTAVQIWDTRTDTAKNIIQSIVSDTVKMRTATIKSGRVKVLESIRSYENAKHRNYPILTIFNGVQRNMSYLGMFDTLDCKVMKYLTYNPSKSDDVLSLKFLVSVLWTGPLGIAVWAVMVLMGFLFISMIGTIVQGYLVSMGAITILAYLSPLVMPCLLFNDTKGYFTTWLSQIRKYATGIPVSLLTLGILMVLTDYVFYGDPAQYQQNNMFDSNGNVNQSCGASNPEKAPLICLLYLMNNAVQPSNCTFGICVFTTPNFGHLLLLLLVALLKGIIILNIVVDSLGKIESFMNSMLGTSQDVALNGSIFNSSTGLFSHLKARGESIISAPVDIARDISDKVSHTKQQVKSASNTSAAKSVMEKKEES